ncbi:s-adenosylmethionine-dependent methyltransferase [Pyrenophora teres f. maculata]|nr:s-adenosylmethionine-dependent methyltransferase [Pyrenophora teres f. maculata]
MPRIPTSLLRKAHAIDSFLPALLAPCRDLDAARNELRWLREHVEHVAKARRARGKTVARGPLLRRLVKERASGKPLQYLLGSEYFGDLEIRCKPGVLIPRADTAASVTHLVGLLQNVPNLPPELRVLDLCTGTGCIPLLFKHRLSSARNDISLRLLGVDISLKAIRLASHNLQRLQKDGQLSVQGNFDFLRANVMTNPFVEQTEGIPSVKAALNYAAMPSFWDILISNPPYISPSEFWKTTTRSVRGFEPKLALVPPPKQQQQSDVERGDMFYPRLLELAREVEAKIVLLEIADMQQALRVAQRAQKLHIFDGVEIWREQPDITGHVATTEDGFTVVGQGNARSVLCWRGLGTSWLGKSAASTPAEDAVRLFQSSWGAFQSNDYQPETVPSGSSDDLRSLEPQFDLEASSGYRKTPFDRRVARAAELLQMMNRNANGRYKK